MRAEVSFEMDVPTKDVDGKPISPTEEQVRQWLEFELGCSGVLPGGNPLYTNSLETDIVGIEFENEEESNDETE